MPRIYVSTDGKVSRWHAGEYSIIKILPHAAHIIITTALLLIIIMIKLIIELNNDRLLVFKIGGSYGAMASVVSTY